MLRGTSSYIAMAERGSPIVDSGSQRTSASLARSRSELSPSTIDTETCRSCYSIWAPCRILPYSTLIPAAHFHPAGPTTRRNCAGVPSLDPAPWLQRPWMTNSIFVRRNVDHAIAAVRNARAKCNNLSCPHLRNATLRRSNPMHIATCSCSRAWTRL